MTRRVRTADPAGADPAPRVLLVSSVRIGPLEALGPALATTLGVEVPLVAGLTDDAWRRSRGRGRLAVAIARARGQLFPLTVRLGPGDGRVVVATTNPFWLPTALVLRGVRPLVVLVYDVYPDALQVRWSVPGWLVRVVDRLVGHGLRRADVVVALGPRVAELLRTRHGLTGTVAVIPTGADPEMFRAAAPACDDGILVSYVGNSGSMHEGRTMALALRRVLDEHPEVRAVVATRGDRAEELIGPLRDAPRVTLRGALDDAEFRSVLAATDVALVTLDAAAGSVSLPSKVHPALAAGCAVLAVAPAESDLADLITGSGAGVVVPPGDVRGAVAALERLVADAGRRAEHAKAARRAAEDFTPAALATRWAEILRPLLRAAERPR